MFTFILSFPVILISAFIECVIYPTSQMPFFWSELERFWCQLFKLSSCIIVNNLVGMLLKKFNCLGGVLSEKLVLRLVRTPILCLTLKKFLTKCIIRFYLFFSFGRGISSGKIWSTACKRAFFLVCSGLSLIYIYILYTYNKVIVMWENHWFSR